MLYDAIAESLDNNAGLWTHVVVFGADSWKVVKKSDETFQGAKLMRPTKGRTAKPPLEAVPVKPRRRIPADIYKKKVRELGVGVGPEMTL